MPIKISLLCVLPIHLELHTEVGLPVHNNYLDNEARGCEVFDKNFASFGDLQLPFLRLHSSCDFYHIATHRFVFIPPV